VVGCQGAMPMVDTTGMSWQSSVASSLARWVAALSPGDVRGQGPSAEPQSPIEASKEVAI
jgi:hypothetical protein